MCFRINIKENHYFGIPCPKCKIRPNELFEELFIPSKILKFILIVYCSRRPMNLSSQICVLTNYDGCINKCRLYFNSCICTFYILLYIDKVIIVKILNISINVLRLRNKENK